MGKLLDAVTAFFEEAEWHYRPIEGKTSLLLRFEGENAQWPCYAHVQEEYSQFVFHSVPALDTPEEKLLDMAECISRINYGLSIGNFEIDFNDGEVRYKTGIDVEGTEINNDLIRNMVNANVSMTDRYLPALLRVLIDNADPADAVARIEEEE